MIRLRYGAPKNAKNGYYAVRRETLVLRPVLDRQNKKFGDLKTDQWKCVFRASTEAIVSARTQRLEAWATLSDAEKHKGPPEAEIDATQRMLVHAADRATLRPEERMRVYITEQLKRLERLEAFARNQLPAEIRKG